MILLSRVEVRVTKRSAVRILDGAANRARLLTPIVQSLDLRFEIEERACVRPRRLEMVGDDEDQMLHAIPLRGRASDTFPRAPERIAREPRQRPHQFIETSWRFCFHLKLIRRKMKRQKRARYIIQQTICALPSRTIPIALENSRSMLAAELLQDARRV